MAIDMTPEQREVWRENYRRAVEGLGLNRREFMKALPRRRERCRRSSVRPRTSPAIKASMAIR